MAISLDQIRPVKVEKKKPTASSKDITSWLSKDITLFRGLGTKDKHKFYEELDLLLGAGLDLENSLMLIKSQSKVKSKKSALVNLLISLIIKGKSLSESMKISQKFSDYEYYSIQIGEETGNLEATISNLKQFYSDVIEQKRKLTSALSYPIIVLLVAVSAVFFLLQFVVPLFEDVFKRFDGELPYLTRLIITWSENAGLFLPWFLLIVLILSFLFYINRKKEVVRKVSSRIVINTPILGVLIKKIYLARIFNALSLLVSSKNPLLHSLSMIRKMVRFYPLEKSLEQIEEDVLNGKALFESMSEHKIFDQQIVTLIKVSEEVGQLEPVLKRISESLSIDISHRLNNLGNLLEPILIVLVGGMVALILVAMYLPLFNLSTSIY